MMRITKISASFNRSQRFRQLPDDAMRVKTDGLIETGIEAEVVVNHQG
jgi:hypothetical protein